MDGSCNIAHVIGTLYNRDPIRIFHIMTGPHILALNRQISIMVKTYK